MTGMEEVVKQRNNEEALKITSGLCLFFFFPAFPRESHQNISKDNDRLQRDGKRSWLIADDLNACKWLPMT